ncbi:TadE family protein [Cupriavidus numazuensis]|uniref:TadE-like domain-containing protein n=1 Tax=Cupriavidus numazuensis TaxID=221992 RepID=A0ABN7Q4G3_9BURK|nr:TadE family protein [Cupriavidus numazuensis]CAG2156819.1 hypothetical protein LMG26411_05376 [Cupriavidus numazuensis]
MRPTRPNRYRKAARGVAAVEMGILLPILIFLTLPVIDFARAIQANLILVNLTREGASLASRSSTYTPQAIMNSLAATTPPLKMPGQGMIYITKIMGYCETSGCAPRNIVLEQHHWLQGWKQAGGSAPASRVWGCGSGGGSWITDGSCSGIPTGKNAPTANAMTGSLHDGDVVYVVETYYSFDMLFKGLTMSGMSMPTLGPNLYSVTAF